MDIIERFSLKIKKDEDDDGKIQWIDIRDNNRRDSYGIYTTSKFMGNNDHISEYSLRYFVEILNELYTENQALKNGNEYHKLVLSKLDDEIDFYHQVLDEAASDKKKIYFEIIKCLEEVEEELQGEDYC